MLQPRLAAYSRMARLCKGRVCWSWVETRAYRPARHGVFLRPDPWPKTLGESGLLEARFPAIFAWLLRMAETDCFRPCGIHHNAMRDATAVSTPRKSSRPPT